MPTNRCELTGRVVAMALGEGPSVINFIVALADAPLLRVTEAGVNTQDEPGMGTWSFPLQSRVTVLVNCVSGVIVTVVVPVCPAVMTSGATLAKMLKSGTVTRIGAVWVEVAYVESPEYITVIPSVCGGVIVTVPWMIQLPLPSWVTVVVTPGSGPLLASKVRVPVGFSAALLAGFPVTTVAVIITLAPKMMLLGLIATVVVVGYRAVTVDAAEIEPE
jgi:hypothetical protein